MRANPRTWENIVGRSLPHWKFYYPKLQETFPEQLGNIDLRTFYHAINKVKPSLIRVEATKLPTISTSSSASS